ncbi:MAG: tetratricopeptide repeat protein, partial [Actinomycetia bacterium]|nr:tetratricopeptide repeat protein [Actinomycetes bacterium]
MPERAAHFVERADLDRVRQVMATSGTRVLCAVSGMRGVGKSQLAAAFANECIDDGWGFVAWVQATSRARIITQMAQIARDRGFIKGEDAKDDDKAARRLCAQLSGLSDSDSRLLVFDNVESADDLAGLIPRGPGMRVLVTATRTDVPGEPLDIGVYTLEEAIGYLVEATSDPDRAGAEAVAEALGCLPVALTQAAVTIQTWYDGYTDYLADLNAEPLDEVLDQAGDPYPAKAGAAIRMAFRVVASRLATESPALGASATAILDALSVLAEGGTPRQWLYGTTGDSKADRRAVGLLARYNILTKSHGGDVVSLHRLQARVRREDLTEAARLPEAADTAARVLSQVDIPDDAGWEEKQATAQALAAQLVDLLGQAYSEPVTHDLRVLSISAFAMKWCLEAGLAGLAVQLAPYTDLHEQVLGPDHPSTLTSRGNLALAYQDAGRLGKAVPLYEEVLAGRVRVLGPGHPDTLNTR